MPTPAKTYDLTRLTLIIGGRDIAGYGEGGAVSVEPMSPIGETSVGTDGQVTLSRTNDFRAKVTVTVRQNSKAHKDLHALQILQEAQPAPLDVDFLLIDAATGERVTDSQVLFTARPTKSFGRAVADRVFEMVLPNGFALGNNDAAPLILQ